MKQIKYINTMLRLVLSIVLLLVYSCSNDNDRDEFKVESILEEYKKEIKAGGLALAYLKKGEPVKKEVIGVSAKGKDLQTDMLFGVASNTKIFTACLIMILNEQGRIALNGTIDRYLESATLVDKPNVNPKVTIKQLLNHSSGLAEYVTEDKMKNILINASAKPYKPLELLKGLTKYSEPGKFTYRNTNYLILGLIIERITGKKYHEFLRQEILDKHGLSNSYLGGKETYPKEKLAHSWVTIDGSKYSDMGSIDRSVVESLGWAAGSLITTLDDMIKFYKLLFIDKKIVKETSLEKMLAVPSGIVYGFGIQVRTISGVKVYTHGGLTLAYESLMVFDTNSQNIAAVFKNSAGLKQQKEQLEEIAKKVLIK